MLDLSSIKALYRTIHVNWESQHYVKTNHDAEVKEQDEKDKRELSMSDVDVHASCNIPIVDDHQLK